MWVLSLGAMKTEEAVSQFQKHQTGEKQRINEEKIWKTK